jgi:hypothetical protein
LRNASAFRVGRPFASFIGPLTPPIRAQNERLRPLALPLGLDCVTGALRLAPSVRLKCLRPAAVKPPDGLLCSFFISFFE